MIKKSGCQTPRPVASTTSYKISLDPGVKSNLGGVGIAAGAPDIDLSNLTGGKQFLIFE